MTHSHLTFVNFALALVDFHFWPLAVSVFVVFASLLSFLGFGYYLSDYNCNQRHGKDSMSLFDLLPFVLLPSSLLFCLSWLPLPSSLFLCLVHVMLHFYFILGRNLGLLWHDYDVENDHKFVTYSQDIFDVCSPSEIWQDYFLIEFFNWLLLGILPEWWDHLIDVPHGFNVLNSGHVAWLYCLLRQILLGQKCSALFIMLWIVLVNSISILFHSNLF